jgi:hypothetical protein
MGMQSAQSPEFVLLSRLHTDADTIDAQRSIGQKFVFRGTVGIALAGDFGMFRQGIPTNGIHQLRHIPFA